MKKLKLLTSLSAVSALGGGVALTTTSCKSDSKDDDKSNKNTAFIIAEGDVLNVADVAKTSAFVAGVMIKDGEIVKPIAGSTTITTDNENVMAIDATVIPTTGSNEIEAYAVSFYVGSLGEDDIIPKGQNSIVVNLTVNVLTASNEIVTATTPVTIAKTDYTMVTTDSGGITTHTFMTDGNIDVDAKEVTYQFKNFGSTFSYSSLDSLTATAKGTKTDKITVTPDKSNVKVKFECDKSCPAGVYNYEIKAVLTESATNESITIIGEYTVAVQTFTPTIEAIYQPAKGTMEFIGTSGKTIQVVAGDKVMLAPWANGNMAYMAAAMESGAYAFEVVEKGKTTLPTGLNFSVDKGIQVQSTFVATATLAIRLANNAGTKQDPTPGKTTYATFEITLTPKSE